MNLKWGYFLMGIGFCLINLSVLTNCRSFPMIGKNDNNEGLIVESGLQDLSPKDYLLNGIGFWPTDGGTGSIQYTSWLYPWLNSLQIPIQQYSNKNPNILIPNREGRAENFIRFGRSQSGSSISSTIGGQANKKNNFIRLGRENPKQHNFIRLGRGSGHLPVKTSRVLMESANDSQQSSSLDSSPSFQQSKEISMDYST